MHASFHRRIELFRYVERTLFSRTRRRDGASRLRPRLETLEDRLNPGGAFPPNTYFWTAKGDGMTWNDPNNWQHFTAPTFAPLPGSPPPFSDVIFPSRTLLPKGSPTTINFNFAYSGMPIDSLEADDSYTFQGNPLTIVDLLTVPSSFSGFSPPPVVTFLLGGLSFTPGAVIETAPNTTIQLANATTPTGLQLSLTGPVTKTGGGQLVIDTQSIQYPNSGLVQPIPITIQGGTIALDASSNLEGISFMISSAANLLIADNVVTQIGPVYGTGTIDVEGKSTTGDQTSLSVYVPASITDAFHGSIEGLGQFTQLGHGTLILQNLDFGDAGSVQVSFGSLFLDGSISAGSLNVFPYATLGGVGFWSFSGSVLFQPGSTYEVTLDGTAPGRQYTTLKSQGTMASVNIASSILSGSVGYQYQQGDQFTIIASPSITGQFQNVIGGVVLLGGVSFQVSYSSTAVTLTALKSETTTKLTRSSSTSNPGQKVSFSAMVRTRTGPVTSGYVTFAFGSGLQINAQVNSNGVATAATQDLPVGTTPVVAGYDGAGANLPSTSPTLTQTVVPYSTRISLASAPDPSTAGQPVTLTAHVSAAGKPVAAGTVTFSRGRQFLGTAPLDASGNASLMLTSLPAGKVKIQAIYTGSTDYFGSSSQKVTQSVLPAPTSTTLALSTQTTAQGDARYVLIATVAIESSGAPVPGGTVVFRRNGQTIGTARLKGGTAMFSLGARAPANQKFVAAFQKSKSFLASTSPPVQT
jgi:hypothetical protein